MKYLICSILLSSASAVFALPVPNVYLDGEAYSGAYYNPYNNDSFQGGTNTTHFVSTGYLPQTSVTGGDLVSSVWSQDDSVASPLNDGSSIPVTWHADCTSQISGSASMGALHAYGYAVQEITPFSVSYVQTDDQGDSVERTGYNTLIATAHATMGASAEDSVTVVNKTLPPGTLVRVRLGLTVDCSVTVSGGGTGSAVTAQAYCQVLNGGSSYDTDPINFNSGYDGNSINSNMVFSVPVGTTFYVFQSLSADCFASSDLGSAGQYEPLSYKPPTSSASADAGNTAHFYLDVIDPGATLTSVSGHNYSAPPQLTLLTTNGFALSAACVPQQTWVLQYSTDFVHWTDAGTNQADSNGYLLIPLPAPNAVSKYYRFRSP